MILGSGVKAYVCAAPIDMRRSIDGLAQLVAPVFGGDPFNGAVYVFLGKRRNRVKLLVWDRHGFWLLYKRLEHGRFPAPQMLAQRGLSMAELMAFLDGIDLTRARVIAPLQVSRVA
jgi:transposase